MHDTWDDRRKALEEQYFDQQDKAALSKLASKVRKSSDNTESSKDGQIKSRPETWIDSVVHFLFGPR